MTILCNDWPVTFSWIGPDGQQQDVILDLVFVHNSLTDLGNEHQGSETAFMEAWTRFLNDHGIAVGQSGAMMAEGLVLDKWEEFKKKLPASLTSPITTESMPLGSEKPS